MLWKGQHSWNISVMKEARADLKVVLESSTECPSRGIFFVHKKNHQNKQTYFKTILQALLLVTKQADPIKGLLKSIRLFNIVLSSTLQSPLKIV